MWKRYGRRKLKNWRRRKFCRGCKRSKFTLHGYCPACVTIINTCHVAPEEVMKMGISQLNACKVCGCRPGRRLTPNLDEQGRVRGLLCQRCTIGLRYLSSETLLDSALAFMKLIPVTMPHMNLPAPAPEVAYDAELIERILGEPTTLRARARKLSKEASISEDAAMSRLRRYASSKARRAQAAEDKRLELLNLRYYESLKAQNGLQTTQNTPSQETP